MALTVVAAETSSSIHSRYENGYGGIIAAAGIDGSTDGGGSVGEGVGEAVGEGVGEGGGYGSDDGFGDDDEIII